MPTPVHDDHDLAALIAARRARLRRRRPRRRVLLLVTVAFGSHGEICPSFSGWRLRFDGMTPSRLPSDAKRNEFSPSVIGRS